MGIESWRYVLGGFFLAVLTSGAELCRAAPVIDTAFTNNYAIFNLGSLTGVNLSYGGITFLSTDNNRLLVGGCIGSISAGCSSGTQIYSLALARDPVTHHIIGTGAASVYAPAPGLYGGGLDGLTYGPGGDLFYTTYPDATLGQIKPDGTSPTPLIDMSGSLAAFSSPGGIVYVPSGFPGAGQLKVVSDDGAASTWYNLTLQANASGTYNVTGITQQMTTGANPVPVTTGANPEGMVYVPANKELAKGQQSLLVSEFRTQTLALYNLDANGNPIAASRRSFFTGFSTGTEGLAVDPVTGDYLVGTYSQLYVIEETPEPGTLLLLAAGILALAGRRAAARRRSA